MNLLRRFRPKPPIPAAPGVTFADWVRGAEIRIARLVMGEQLDLRVVRVVRGPMTVTFTVKLAQPNPTNLRRIKVLGPSLAQALGLADVRIDDTAAGIQIELPSPAPRTPDAAWLAQHTSGMAVAIGMDSQRQPIRINLDDHPALFFIGPTRHGKTEGAKSALYALLRANPELQAIILGRRKDWLPMALMPGVVDLISDPATALAAAAWLAGAVLARAVEDRVAGPSYLIVADDLPDLLNDAPAIAGHLGRVASSGGAVRCYLLAITQFAGSKAGDGGAALASNTTARIVYACASAVQAALATGIPGSGAEKLSEHKGDALLVRSGVTQRCTTAWLPEKLVEETPKAGQGREEGEHLLWRIQAGQNGAQNGQNHGYNAPERGRTAQNGQNGPMLTPPSIPGVEAARGRDEDAVSAVPGVLDTGAIAARIEQLRAILPHPRPAPGPLLHPAPPTARERIALRELHALLGSKEKTYFAAWGFKSGRTFAWLNAALAQGESQ